MVRFAGDQAINTGLTMPLRLVEIACEPHRKLKKNARGGPNQTETLLVATDIMDVDADVIALLYRHRWAIETFFRASSSTCWVVATC